ncbi:unnamed protein product [Vitrella brassicaformis CCMP3155]|uniref:Uncharacterized protein n=2 Tax=Vitrella brassicaformis TaxID=1169539 RepID=A0A0G4FHZ7_VITBC|nr:unnamed protein product [Vitrella brassicaformis CCMP3155]|eukprot:CEM13103.1 unnamed protein product [Vitrella brassicaformis CCMP3155]
MGKLEDLFKKKKKGTKITNLNQADPNLLEAKGEIAPADATTTGEEGAPAPAPAAKDDKPVKKEEEAAKDEWDDDETAPVANEELAAKMSDAHIKDIKLSDAPEISIWELQAQQKAEEEAKAAAAKQEEEDKKKAEEEQEKHKTDQQEEEPAAASEPPPPPAPAKYTAPGMRRIQREKEKGPPKPEEWGPSLSTLLEQQREESAARAEKEPTASKPKKPTEPKEKKVRERIKLDLGEDSPKGPTIKVLGVGGGDAGQDQGGVRRIMMDDQASRDKFKGRCKRPKKELPEAEMRDD